MHDIRVCGIVVSAILQIIVVSVDGLLLSESGVIRGIGDKLDITRGGGDTGPVALRMEVSNQTSISRFIRTLRIGSSAHIGNTSQEITGIIDGAKGGSHPFIIIIFTSGKGRIPSLYQNGTGTGLDSVFFVVDCLFGGKSIVWTFT